MNAQMSVPSYSKGSQGLSVFPRVGGIFTPNSISLSPRSRQCGSRYAIRAGRNLPDKEFRYLRTVIVTAAVHRGLDSRLRTPLLVTFRHWAGVSPYTSAFALAETCVFGKQSVGPILCHLPPHAHKEHKVRRSPFFQRYGVNLPSSLTEGRSITSRAFSLPTSVGVRYGRKRVWIEAFLGGLGTNDFRALASPRPCGHVHVFGICLENTLPTGHLACPFARITFPTASPLRSYNMFWCRTIPPACHRLRL